VVGVGDERIREPVLRLELRVLLRRIRADPDDDCVDSLEPREGVLEAARLDGSARGVVLRIEEEDDHLTQLLGQREHGSIVGRCREVGSLIASAKHVGAGASTLRRA